MFLGIFLLEYGYFSVTFIGKLLSQLILGLLLAIHNVWFSLEIWSILGSKLYYSCSQFILSGKKVAWFSYWVMSLNCV